MTSKEKTRDIKSVINEFYHNEKCEGRLTECARKSWLLFQEYCDDILQDLERLEALEKENKKWREIVGCNLCEALGREILLEENEKLKKVIATIKEHVQFIIKPIESTDPALEGLYHFCIKIYDKYGYYETLYKDEAEVLKEVLENE